MQTETGFIKGISRTGGIPRADFYDPETGELIPAEVPYFPSVAPNDEEMRKQREEDNYHRERIPQIVSIDITAFKRVKRSENPELWETLNKLTGEIFSIQAEAKAATDTVITTEIEKLKVAHKELDRACRIAIDALEPIQTELANAQAFYRDAAKQTRDLFLKWGESRSKLRQHPTDSEIAEWNADVDAANKEWEAALARENACVATISAIQAKGIQANKKVVETERAFKASAQRIARESGEPLPKVKRSSYSGMDSSGLR